MRYSSVIAVAIAVVALVALPSAGRSQTPSNGSSSVCSDSLYQSLRKRPLDSLSTREYALFKERDQACVSSLAVPSQANQPMPGGNPSAGFKDGGVATLF